MKFTLTLQQIRSRATDKVYARGLSYYNSGAISDTIQRGNTLQGECQGSEDEPYQVRVALGENGILSASCTCEYDFGGDCKHIVALLLTYLNKPTRFTEKMPLAEALKDRPKEALIQLIEEMVAQYPDLENLLERPMPAVVTPDQPAPPISLDVFQRELRRAVEGYDNWDNDKLVKAVSSVSKSARLFASRGDWTNASLIYSVILEELSEVEFLDYEDDRYWDELSTIFESAEDCLRQPRVSENVTLRQRLLIALLGLYLTPDESDAAADVPDIILRYVQPADLPGMKPYIQGAIQQSERTGYSQYWTKTLKEFMVSLDVLNATEPEEILKRLRDAGMYGRLADKLIELSRFDEVEAVIRDHLNEFDLLRVLYLLEAAGQGEKALEWGLAAYKRAYDFALGTWLIQRYEAAGQQVNLLEVLKVQVREHITEADYARLKATAQALGEWEPVREKLIKHFQGKKHERDLLALYLYDENWDAAWELANRLSQAPNDFGFYEAYDLLVAEKSRSERPQMALQVYIKHARYQIDRRNRQNYQTAAAYLVIVREIYQQLGDAAGWQTLIKGIREEFKRLPALQEELTRVRL